MITAYELFLISNTAPSVIQRVEEELVRAAKQHKMNYCFEETLTSHFESSPKEVAEFFRSKGYKVRYERFQPDNIYYPNVYLYKYYLDWK